MTDHDELRRLAEAATPGPWENYRGEILPPHDICKRLSNPTIAEATGPRDRPSYFDKSAENAAYIAAADPQTILGLLGDIEQYRTTALHLRDELRKANDLAADAMRWHDEAQAEKMENVRLERELQEVRGVLRRITELEALLRRALLGVDCVHVKAGDLGPCGYCRACRTKRDIDAALGGDDEI